MSWLQTSRLNGSQNHKRSVMTLTLTLSPISRWMRRFLRYASISKIEEIDMILFIFNLKLFISHSSEKSRVLIRQRTDVCRIASGARMSSKFHFSLSLYLFFFTFSSLLHREKKKKILQQNKINVHRRRSRLSISKRYRETSKRKRKAIWTRASYCSWQPLLSNSQQGRNSSLIVSLLIL